MAELEFITLVCSEPDELAGFWAAALDGERRELSVSLDPEIVDWPGAGPSLLFKQPPKGTERDLPIHLDLSTSDREETVERLRDLGASTGGRRPKSTRPTPRLRP